MKEPRSPGAPPEFDLFSSYRVLTQARFAFDHSY